MAQNNSSILVDVSTCLRDVMDSIFNNGIISADNKINIDTSNDVGLSSNEALKLIMNKRKLESTLIMNGEEKNHENGNEIAKRMCIINDHQNCEPKG